MATSDGEYESGNDDPSSREAAAAGFEPGNIVINPNQAKDLFDPQAVLISPVDCHVGKYLGQFLSTKIIQSGSLASENVTDAEDELAGEDGASLRFGNSKSSRNWKILGALANPKSPVHPFLWGVVKQDDIDIYFKEAAKCAVIIYDMTVDASPEKIEEVRKLCDALRSGVDEFFTPRVLIIISSLHSWSHTKKNPGDEPFSESRYRWRHTNRTYRALYLLERYVVASGKMTGGRLKGYVIGAGAIYGGGEDCLHHWFVSAWHNARFLEVYGDGKNLMPTVYIEDLARIVQNVMDDPPLTQRYLIAVDPVVYQQDEIAKAISGALGTGKTRRVPAEDIHLNKELTTFQADQHLLNLNIQSVFMQSNFNMEFIAESGLPSIIDQVVVEYRKARNLDPLKVCILGPVASGKSATARKIADMYRLNHFTKEDIITSTLDLMKDASPDEPEGDGIEDGNARLRDEARSILKEVELQKYGDPEGEQQGESPRSGVSFKRNSGVSAISDDLFVRIVKWRLLTPHCQNQGFILDGFPETAKQAQGIFTATDRSIIDSEMMNDEEEMYEGRDIMDPRLVPDRVVVLEASDEFLKQRLQWVPAAELQSRHKEPEFSKVLAAYREANSVYENTPLFFLDMQEIMYFPIDVKIEDGLRAQNITGKVMDLLGKPKSYGLSDGDQNALRSSIGSERKLKLDESEKHILEILETRELEERTANIQQWMETLTKVKREEFEREEAAMIPLRQYLLAHVVPTLTKGLVEVAKAKPRDPVEFLAEFLFANNPGSLNPTLREKFEKDIISDEWKPAY